MPIISVYNGQFEGDDDSNGDIKFKNLLFAGEEYAELFGAGGDLSMIFH